MIEAIENTSQIHFTSSRWSTRDYIPVARYSKHLYNFDSSKFLSKFDTMFYFIFSYCIWQNIIFDRVSRAQNTTHASYSNIIQNSAHHSTALSQMTFISITSFKKNNMQLPPGWVRSCFIKHKHSKDHPVGGCTICEDLGKNQGSLSL